MVHVRSRRPVLAGLVAVLLALALATGCSHPPPAPLRVGSHVWPGYEPLFLARSLGYFDNAPIQLVEQTSASEVSRGLRNGTIEAGTLTLDESLLLLKDSIGLRAVLVMDVSAGADVILARSDIPSLVALRGRRVGVENTALGAYILGRALDIEGVDIRTIEIVPMQISEHEAAWRAGKVDALVTFEPVRTRLLQAGARQIFDSRRIPNEVVDLMVVRRDYLEQSAGPVVRLMDAWFDALRYVGEHRADAVARMSPRLHLSPDDVSSSLGGLVFPDRAENRRLLVGSPAQLEVTADRLVTTMLRAGLLSGPLDPTGLFEGALPGER